MKMQDYPSRHCHMHRQRRRFARVDERAPSRLRLEPLETRSLLAVITVDSLDDNATDDGLITLREAIRAANTDGVADATEAIQAGSGHDTIVFDDKLGGDTILLTMGELAITESLTIDATGLSSSLTIDALGNSRIFNVDDGDDTIDSPTAISGLTLTGGETFDSGGGAIASQESLTVYSSTISNNLAFAREGGGGISASGNVTIISSTISENSVIDGGGGGINASGNVTVISSEISGNSTRGWLGFLATYGGGISGSDVTVTNSTVLGNLAVIGGGISASNSATVTNSTISANEGGGIHASDVTVDSSAVTGNRARGGVRGNVVAVSSSKISGNVANHDGGGIHASSKLEVTSSTVTENAAYRHGGGIFAKGALTVASSTITGNSIAGTAQGEYGGGIFQSGDNTINIENSIVAGNLDDGSAPDLRLGSGALTLRHSLIGDNRGTSLVQAPFGMPDANGNLIGDPNGMGAIVSLLGPLAENGGPTQTLALLPGSPAIDAGDPAFASPPDFDQRGDPFARVTNGRIDMGAFEASFAVEGDFNSDAGVTDIDIDLLCHQEHTSSGNLGFDLNGDNELDYEDVAYLVETVLRTEFGDADLDSAVTMAGDGSVLLTNLGGTGLGWADGDFTCDGLVTASADGALLLANLAADTANSRVQEAADELAMTLAGEMLPREEPELVDRHGLHPPRHHRPLERALLDHREHPDAFLASHDHRTWWDLSHRSLSDDVLWGEVLREIAILDGEGDDPLAPRSWR